MRRLTQILLAATLAAAAGSAGASTSPAQAIAGVWQTKSGGYIQIYKQSNRWRGRIVGSKSDKARYDVHNPDSANRGRRLLGVDIISGLKYSGDDRYRKGLVYNPKNGKTYHLRAELVDRDTLHVRGYVGIPLFGKTQTWQRVNSDARHVHQNRLHRPVSKAATNNTG